MPDFSVAILAGGESRRMGTDKALLQVGGKSLIERLIEVAAPVADECMVIAHSPDRFSHLHLPIHPDKEPGLGPLAGLQAALTHARNDIVLLLACDLPFVTSEFLLCAAAGVGRYQAAIPRDRGGRLQPVCAAYATSCIAAVDRALAAVRRRWTPVHQRQHADGFCASGRFVERFFGLTVLLRTWLRAQKLRSATLNISRRGR